MIEEHGTDDALHDVVGQAHAAIRDYFYKYTLEVAAIVGENDTRH